MNFDNVFRCICWKSEQKSFVFLRFSQFNFAMKQMIRIDLMRISCIWNKSRRKFKCRQMREAKNSCRCSNWQWLFITRSEVYHYYLNTNRKVQFLPLTNSFVQLSCSFSIHRTLVTKHFFFIIALTRAELNTHLYMHKCYHVSSHHINKLIPMNCILSTIVKSNWQFDTLAKCVYVDWLTDGSN